MCHRHKRPGIDFGLSSYFFRNRQVLQLDCVKTIPPYYLFIWCERILPKYRVSTEKNGNSMHGKAPGGGALLTGCPGPGPGGKACPNAGHAHSWGKRTAASSGFRPETQTQFCPPTRRMLYRQRGRPQRGLSDVWVSDSGEILHR